jgi:cell wall-associated NlpC family hydrolase
MRAGVLAAAVLLVVVALSAVLLAPKAEAYSGSGHAVVAEAQTWLGTPYVYGGASRSGVDCSGLTMAVFQQFGVQLPRTAAEQFGAGVPSSGAAGDLVFGDFTGGGIGHVGIAVGDGTMINAPYPGTVVRYDPILPEYTVGYRSVL